MPFCIVKKEMIKIKLSVLLSLVLFFLVNLNPLFAQNTEKITALQEQLETALPEQKADILKSISDEYENIDKQKQIEYAEKIVNLPDSLVDMGLKSEMYEILAEYYKSKNTNKPADNLIVNSENQTNYTALIIFIISIALLITVIITYLLSGKMHNSKLSKIDSQAEEVYNEKYAKLKEVEEKLGKELQPLKLELNKVEKEEAELKKKLKNLEEANYLKNAFLSNMSHEIRTSLNGISGFANILETELALMADENLYSHAQKIQESGSKLENLLTNIIDISRLEANVVEKEIKEHSLLDIITAVEDINSFKANEKGLVFKTKIDQPSPLVVADNEKLKKLLNVLVDNALKYTRKGFVTITGSLVEESNSVKIEIKDTGDGIQKDYALLINNAFSSKIDEHDKSYEGIGIGLRLCKKFIDLMDGKISMKTVDSKGTSFTILLPASTGKLEEGELIETKKPVVTLVNAPELGSLDIFIVEDDRMNRMVLEKMLKKSGTIVTAVDGDDAMKIIKKYQKKNKQYHVMLFDINLPAPWDGIRLMQEIRRIYPEYKNIPFIAQTAYAMAGDKDRFLEAGFDDYIAKPIMKNELLTLIEKQLVKFASKVA